MNSDNLDLASLLVPPSYVNQAASALAKRHKLIKAILSQRRLPEAGLDEASIEQFLQDVALMDSNNFADNVGVGEREARVACPLVARRNYRMAHGVGRYSDICEAHARLTLLLRKAAGSSLLAKLANLLAADALRIAGLLDVSAATLLPLATGMALTVTLLALKRRRPPQARYVLWPRIDQKTCLKCISAAGLEVVVLPNILQGDQVRTDLERIEADISRLGAENIVAVITTSSCFAPRACDRLVEVAKLCRRCDVGHIVNNAYGVQASALCATITAAWRRGRVDAVVQSTDKNFMVPVGGSIVAAGPGGGDLVTAVNSAYPGRASAAPMLDVLITLLHWGAAGWRRVLQEREELYTYARDRLKEFAAAHGCQVLQTLDNPISLALTLDGLQEAGEAPASSSKKATFLGSMLFSRCVSGTRVVERGKQQTVEGIEFEGYGAHIDRYPHDYLTVAAALGTTAAEVDEFLARLALCFKEFRRKYVAEIKKREETSTSSGEAD